MNFCRFKALKSLGIVCACLAAVTLVSTSGCGGPDYKARGIVKGRVTSGKKPLTTGTVMFYAKSGVTGSTTIDPQGNYVLNDAPLGECIVTVTVNALPDNASVRQRLKGGGPKMPAAPKNPEATGPDLPSSPAVPKEVVLIDKKYSNTETSGLTFTVEKREQTFDIEL